MLTLYHGSSRWSWEIARWQGRMRPAQPAGHDGQRIYSIVGDDGREQDPERPAAIYFTSEPGLAAVYAGGKPELRLPTWPTGRWVLPDGIANREGVVLACDFDDGEVIYTAREHSHEEFIHMSELPVERVRVVAHIPVGVNVFDALGAAAPCPPLTAADRARVEAVGRDDLLAIPGPLLEAFEAACEAPETRVPGVPALAADGTVRAPGTTVTSVRLR